MVYRIEQDEGSSLNDGTGFVIARGKEWASLWKAVRMYVRYRVDTWGEAGFRWNGGLLELLGMAILTMVWSATAVTRAIPVGLMTPEMGIAAIHALAPAQDHNAATIGTNGFVRCSVGRR